MGVLPPLLHHIFDWIADVAMVGRSYTAAVSHRAFRPNSTQRAKDHDFMGYAWLVQILS